MLLNIAVENKLPMFRKDLAMKRIILTLAVLGVFGILVSPVLAGGGIHANIVQVGYPHYGGPHGGYHGDYHGGWNGYRAYYPPPPCGYAPYVTRFPPHPPMIYSPYVRPYYYPSNSFYYATPGFSIGVGF
jgi:hypothetical protein